MSSQTFLQLVQLLTILLGFLGVAVTLRSHRRQMHAQMYIEFSARVHNVIRSLPAQTWMANAGIAEEIPARHDELTRNCVQCFHIIADLFHLHQHGYIAPELWRPWQRAIKRALQGPVLKREWQAVESAFEFNTEFCRFMRHMVHDDAAGPKHSRAEAA